MENAYLIIGSSVLFVVLLWIAVGVRHLRFLRRGVLGDFEGVMDGLRRRHDSMPLLVEVLSKYAGEDSAQFQNFKGGAISSRDAARRIYHPCGKKTEKEYDFSKALDNLIWYGEENDEVKKNIVFLELKKEFEDINRDIENRSNLYNQKVVRFNQQRNGLLLRPLAFVMRMKRAGIFEFEK